MHSRSAACVFGGARLISSTRRRFAKMGPGRNSNSFERWLKTLTPVTSEGSRSGVNCMREKEQSIERASAFASIVFPTPGKSSMIRCPSLTRQRTTRRSVSSSACTTKATFSTMRATVRAASSTAGACGWALASTRALQQVLSGVEDGGRNRRLARLRHLPLPVARDQHHLVLLGVEPDVFPSYVVVDDQVHILVCQHPPLPRQALVARLGAERDNDLAVRPPRG